MALLLSSNLKRRRIWVSPPFEASLLIYVLAVVRFRLYQLLTGDGVESGLPPLSTESFQLSKVPLTIARLLSWKGDLVEFDAILGV